MGMLCNRRGGCFAGGCFQWGCPTGNCTTGCCGGGGGSPANIFLLMMDPCHKKRVRNSMQLVYGAYNGGCLPPYGFCPPPPRPSVPPPCPTPAQEPIQIIFKCPTYCTPLPEPVINY